MINQTDIAAFRYGFGLPLPKGAPMAPPEMLAALGKPDRAVERWVGVGLDAALPDYHRVTLARGRARLGEAERLEYRESLRQMTVLITKATRAQIARPLGARDGFRERLVRFWTDHFTTRGRFTKDRILPFTMIEDAIRPNVVARFSDLLQAATLHPAMLVYLNQGDSVGPNSVTGKKKRRGLNENLGRELLELHTLGVGAGYTQDDVRQMAALLTGLNFKTREGQVFMPDWAEPGAEMVLGREYGGEGEAPIRAALVDLAMRPETARHLARKLVVHFITDAPDPAMIEAMAAAYMDSGSDLLALYGAMLNHPGAFAPQMLKARQPFDFMVSSLRALGISAEDVMTLPEKDLRRWVVSPMAAMGQNWLGPNGPDGWSEEPNDWITPRGLAARISWAMDAPRRLLQQIPDPRQVVEASLASLASEPLTWAVSGAENQVEALGLVLSSPEFNRR